jgi:hypothetical protein
MLFIKISQELHDGEIRGSDAVIAMQQLSGTFNQAIAQLPIRHTSGPVGQRERRFFYHPDRGERLPPLVITSLDSRTDLR